MSTLVNVVHSLFQLSVFAQLTMAVAVVTFGLAVSHVVRPGGQKLALMRPMSLASIFATLSGLFGGWVALLSSIAATPDGHIPVAEFSRGVGESLTVGFVCFGFLAAAWLLVAVGTFRGGRVDVV